MFISPKGLDLIKSFEACKLKAYKDVVGVWTIGWGHTKGVYPGQEITQDLADRWLIDDVWYFERGVDDLVKVVLNQNQFDALVCFSFNVGLDIDEDTVAEGLGDSTLLRKLNDGDYPGAALEFPKWNRAGGRVINGLTRRRVAEQSLFLSGSG